MAEGRPSKVVTIPTPDGPAFYPFGSWGHGYILDTPTRAAMDTYLRRIIWIVLPILPLSDVIGGRLGVDKLVSGFGGLLALCAINIGATLYILRHSRRTASRVSPEEVLRRAIELRGHMAVEAACWCNLIISVGVAVVIGLAATGIERALFAPIGIAFLGFSVLQLWRAKRLDTA